MSEKEKLKRYDQLMLRNKGLIVKVCQVYCPNDGEKALDLFQDIALKVWTRMDTFREESAEATWLWHIAINTAIDSIRANQRRPQLVFGDTLPERSTEETPRRIDDLYEAIAHLPADDQLLITARLDGLDYHQIAQQTGQNENSLRVRYNRIVKRLRIMLKGK